MYLESHTLYHTILRHKCRHTFHFQRAHKCHEYKAHDHDILQILLISGIKIAVRSTKFFIFSAWSLRMVKRTKSQCKIPSKDKESYLEHRTLYHTTLRHSCRQRFHFQRAHKCHEYKAHDHHILQVLWISGINCFDKVTRSAPMPLSCIATPTMAIPCKHNHVQQMYKISHGNTNLQHMVASDGQTFQEPVQNFQ